MLALAPVYRTVSAVGGGFITAVPAPTSPIYLVIAPGIIGLVATTVGTFANREKAIAFGTGIRLH
jgi:hypothetical protein